MFEQSFRNIDNLLRKDKGLSTEIDYVEQTSWLLFLKYLEDLEINKSLEAELNVKVYTSILDKKFTWSSWAYPQKADKTLGTRIQNHLRDADRFCPGHGLFFGAGGHRRGRAQAQRGEPEGLPLQGCQKESGLRQRQAPARRQDLPDQL